MYVDRRGASRWRGCRCGRSLLVALGVDEVHDQLVLVELEGEVELEELVEELDVALADGSSSLGFLLEELPLDCAVRDCGWR